MYRILFFIIIFILISFNSFENDNNKNEINCGVIALWNCSRLLGINISINEIDNFIYNKEETSFYDLKLAAENFGMVAKAFKMNWQELSNLKTPAIAWFNKNHFVVIDRIIDDKALILNYFNPPILYSKEEFEKFCDGTVLVLYKNEHIISDLSISPKIVLDKLNYNFSLLEEDSQTSVTFLISNIGKDDLKISNIDKTCECSNFEIGKTIIKSNQTIPLILHFDFSEEKGMKDINFTIFSNDPKNPKVVLNVTAFIKRPFEFTPSKLNLGDIVSEKIKNTEIFILAPDDGNYTITNIEVSTPNISYELKPYLNPYPIETKQPEDLKRKRWALKLSYFANSSIGDFKETIIFYTNHPRTKKIEIPILGKIVEDITCSPGNLFFGFCKNYEKITREIVLVSRSQSNFKIKQVLSNNIPVSIRFDPNQNSYSHKLNIEFIPDNKFSNIKDNILIKTISETKEQTISLPIFAIVQ